MTGGALAAGFSQVVCIGASTGGTEALRAVVSLLPQNFPPVLMVQHMPESFTAAFAKRLDNQSKIHVKEAVNGETLRPGTAYLAPGHSHLGVRRERGALVCTLARDEPVNRHRPSVDVLFHAAALELKAQAMGVLLTGMGKDGAAGLLAMHRVGAWTLAQDEASCVVYGMPREAVRLGAVDEVVPLHEIAARLVERLARRGR